MLSASLLLVAAVFSHVDTVSRHDIHEELGALVRVDTTIGPNGRDSVRIVAFAIDRLPRLPLLGPFLRAHGRLVWYLASHTPGAEARLLNDRDNAVAVRDSIVGVLRTNAAFNEHFLGMLTQYWRGQGSVIAAFATPSPSTISAAQLRRIGARFFFPDGISATGDTLFTHICAGINGISDLPEPVDPLIEAFVFVAVNNAVMSPKSQLMSAFEMAGKRAKVTSASRLPGTRILRAQGALWSELERSDALGRAIEVAYAHQRAVLPFRIARAP